MERIMKKNIIVTTLTLAALATSCAGPATNKRDATYSPVVKGKNLVPQIKISDFEFTRSKGRFPASSPSKETTDISNKKLYFMTLLGQYESLKSHSFDYNAPEVKICPHFHMSLLEYNGKSAAPQIARAAIKPELYSYDKSKLSDPTYLSKNPELLLPLTKDDIEPRVVDIIKGSTSSEKIDETVKRAIDIHLAKTYTELRSLCEYGVSDNYYIYENLITHVNNTQFGAQVENMNTLLKTTIFSNHALMTSLAKNKTKSIGRAIASTDKKSNEQYSNEVFARLNVNWAHEYFNSIRSEK